MNDRQLETVKQVGEFLAGTEIVEFSIESTHCFKKKRRPKPVRLSRISSRCRTTVPESGRSPLIHAGFKQSSEMVKFLR